MNSSRSITKGGRIAVLGGTFDRLHAGHLALMDAAFQRADEVRIGLTTDEYLAAHPKPGGERIRTYARRRSALERLLRRRYPNARFGLSPLHDRFGRSVEPGIDLLVVSAETLSGARLVNAERRRRGLRPLSLVRVPLLRGEDGLPLSSRRIRSGDVDAQGRRRTPVRIGVSISGASISPSALRSAIRTALPGVRIRLRILGSLRAPNPLEGARNAAQHGNELGVGLARRPDGSWTVAVMGTGLPPRVARRPRPRPPATLPSLAKLFG